jgi:glycerol-3-phosphate O-acyltransferase / dihydroxyacetone phosphate acyltransferase
VSLLGFFRLVSSIYFREIEVTGNVPGPDTRGRLFGANHFNGLIDPILVLTNAPCRIAPLAKSTLWKTPVLKWLLDAADAVPIQRRVDDPSMKTEANTEALTRVSQHLAGGGNTLVFPEGISHTEPQVQKLKTGAGRMLSAAREHGGKGLTFQAVGLEFDERDTFRSRALVVYGPVRSVDALASREGDLVKAITEQLAEDLAELVVEGATWDDHQLIARVARMFAHDAGDTSLEAWNAIGRQVEAARKSLGPGAALYTEVRDAVTGYFDALDAAGLTDEEVARGDAHRPRRKRRAALLALTAPLAIPGFVLYWLPYQIPRLVVRRIADEERDVVSTKKLATGLVVFPVWAGALVAGSFVLLPPPLSFGAAAVAVLSPFAALHWLDHLSQRRSGRAGPVDLASLRSRRAEVMVVLARARATVDAGGLRPSSRAG